VKRTILIATIAMMLQVVQTAVAADTNAQPAVSTNAQPVVQPASPPAVPHATPPVVPPAAQPVIQPAQPVVDPLMKLATARAAVEIAIRDGSAVFDRTKNGYVDAETAIERDKDKITDILSKAKEAHAGDKTFAGECDKMMAEVEKKWDKDSREYDVDISARYDSASETFDELKDLFTTFADSEQKWKKSKLDLEPLGQNFTAVEKRLTETVAKGKKAVDDLKERRKTWDEELAKIEQFVSDKSGETKAATP
jgi:peptidoglycan hydrolase CwlO-like protein